MKNPLTIIGRSAVTMTRTLLDNVSLLAAITRVELSKKYAGSVLGASWLFLQPMLLLSVYLFVYLVVFKMRFPGFSSLDYVLYVFAGLIPYMASMDAISSGAVSIKQNIHLVKNVMLPIELVPVRAVLVASLAQAVGLALVVVMSALNGSLSLHLLWLPVVWAFHLLMLFGIVWILSSLAVALPDISYFVSLFLFLLMWVSPIGFTPDMVPPEVAAVLYLNPVYYLLEMYRDSLIFGRLPSAFDAAVYVGLSLSLFAIGSTFFRAFRGVLLDYE